mgnify:CR=1 FL=1
MKEKLEQIREQAQQVIDTVKDLKGLEEIRVAYLGKKGELTGVLRGMKELSAEERPVIGQVANEVRSQIEARLEERRKMLGSIAMEAKLEREKLDVTMPGNHPRLGHKHPLYKTLEEVQNIFIGMGYNVVDGPEVESQYYDFEALNIPEGHPARDEQDTFYIKGARELLLRTQTSPVQVRTLMKTKPPIKVISPGRCFRCDTPDATHSPMFHQIEGLVVDEGITMADLKGTLDSFAKQLFGTETRTKFRPHHFPFTEPSAEMDVSCFKCGGKGCRVCKGSGWIEVLGCGMVHPHVLKVGGLDTEKYTGFAFGMGVERAAMLKYGVDDIRLFYENDMRFINQFK